MLSCYRLDGTKVYAVEYGNPWKGSYPEARTTPTYSDGHLYVVSGMGEVVCINAEDGKIVWSVNGGDRGNILLHNEQVRPLNVFINRQQLAEALGVKGKVNVILSPNNITSDAFHSIWRPHDSGLQPINDSIIGIDRVFLPHSVVETLNPSTRYLAYFVNSLGTIPYSFVTATDRLKGDETIRKERSISLRAWCVW